MTATPVPATDRRPVVVGIDGSDRSKAALAWGAHYASLTDAPLVVVAAWRFPTDYGWTWPIPEGWSPEADTQAVANREVEEVLGPEPGLAYTVSVVEGHPAEVLTDASARASIVVVGSRGRGQFAGMLLGSVSEHLTAHARCPVVVVRGEAKEDGVQPEGGTAGAKGAAGSTGNTGTGPAT
jgi:nucleotide-binding universal stress UspA family protein